MYNLEIGVKLFELFQPLCEEGKIVPGVNTTQDVQPGEIHRQAAKMGFILDANGCPPTFQKGSAAFTNAKDTVNKGDDWMGPDGTKLKESLDEIRTIEPFNAGTDDANHNRLKMWTEQGIPPKIGEIKDWTIHCEQWPESIPDMPRFYFLDSKGETVGSARLSTLDYSGHQYRIGHIWIKPIYKGQGYGIAFYSWLIEQGIILHADYDQTPDSQKIWMSLAKRYKVRMTKGDWKSGPITDISSVWDGGYNGIGLVASKS